MRDSHYNISTIRTWILLGIILMFPFIGLRSQTPDKMVLIKTTMGDIKITLYEETPLHVKLV